MGKNQLSTYLKELEVKGFIKYIADTLHVSQEHFKLYLVEDTYNLLYKTIYDYCLMQDVVPPYKDIDTNDIGLIAAEFQEPDLLLSILKKRCPQLPQKPSMNYFTKVLRNKRAETKEPPKYEFFL